MVLALALGALGAGSAFAANDRPDLAALQNGIAELAVLVETTEGQILSVTQLLERVGLGHALTPSAPPGLGFAPLVALPVADGVQGVAMDMRLALTLFIQVAGATDNRAVQSAQGPDSALRALVIRQGNATMADVERLAVELGLQDPGETGDFTLKVPLVIWEGAALTLGPGDALRLSRPDGAFVINFGHFAMTGAMAERTGAQNPHLARFAPFIASVGSASMQVQGSRIRGLGFGRTRGFAGLSLLHNTLMGERQRSFLRDTLFDTVVSVVIGASSDVDITGNRFVRARGEGLILAGSPRANVVSNVFAGPAEFNAIQIVEGSSDAVVSGNIVMGGAKSGIVVRSASHRPYLANNIVWQRAGGGITVDHADCANIHSNFVIENAQKGIEVRASDGSIVRGNHVLNNRSAGIWISAQEPQARTFVVENVLLANSAGIATATGERVVLLGNDFRAQFPRFLAGDLARQSPHIAGNLEGVRPMLLTSAGAVPVPGGLSDCARN